SEEGVERVRRRTASRVVDDPDDTAAAEEAALRILTAATQSVTALQRRLRQRGFSALAARVAADRCRELGYVDDTALAAALTRRMQRAGRGSARIALELRSRGVARDAIAAAVGSISPAGDEAAALD